MLPSDMTIHNRYRIIYAVDERPGSTTYRGRDEQSGRLVLVAALAYQGETRDSIALLARQAAATHHDALLSVVDHFEDGDTYYVICEDNGGQDLERTLRARGGPLPESATLAQARRMLDALEYLHRQKPALHLGDPLAGDIWIGEDGTWYITPFTLIRPIGHGPSPYRARELDLPTGEPNAASDLYALCAMLYQALTGWAPPTAAQRESGTPLNGPRSLNPNLSTLIEQVLLRGLQLKPENRYQVTREMRQSLEMVDIMDGRSLGLGADVLPGSQPFAGPPAAQPAAPPTPAAPPAPAAAQPPYPSGGYAPVPPPQPAPAYLPQPGAYAPPPPQPAPAPPAAYQPMPGQPYPPGMYPPQPQRRGISTGCLIVAAVVLTLAAVAVCAALAWFVPGSPLPSLLGARATIAPAQPTALGAPATAAPTTAAPGGGVVAPSPIPPALGARAITLANATQITQTREITGVVLGPVAYSPDGKTLAIGISNLIDLRDSTSLAEVDPPRRLAGHTGQVFVLAWSPDSKLLASGAMDDPVIRLWNASDGSMVRQLQGHSESIRAVAFSPDGKFVASGSLDRTVRLWDAASGNSLWVASDHTDFISSIAFTPDGKTLASSSRDGTVRLWDVALGRARPGFAYQAPLNPANNKPLWTTGISFSSDGKIIAVGLLDGTVALVDAATGTTERTLKGHSDIIVSRGVQFAPDGKTLATGSFDGTVRLWDVASGTQKAELRGHGLRVLSLSYSPDGKHLVSTSDEGGQMLVWDTEQASISDSLHVGQGLIWSILFSQDGSVLGTVGYNGTARLQLLGEDRFRTLLGSAAANKSLAFLSQGRIVSITDQNTLAVIAPNEPQAKELAGMDGRPLNVVTSSNSALIVAGSSTGAIGLWDGNGTAKPAIRSGLQVAYALAVSSDGQLVAVGGPPDDARIEVWDTTSAKLRQTFQTGTSSIANLAFQPDGDLLAETDLQGGLRIWNARDGKLVKQVTATPQQQWFSALAFSPDGSILVTGTATGDTIFWNAQTGEQGATLTAQQPDIGIYSLAFSPDGQQLAFGLSDQSVRIFALK